MRHLDAEEGLSIVGGAVHAGVQHVDRVLVLGISEDPRVVPCALAEAAIAVRARPRRSSVCRSENPAGIRFDDGPQMIRVDR